MRYKFCVQSMHKKNRNARLSSGKDLRQRIVDKRGIIKNSSDILPVDGGFCWVLNAHRSRYRSYFGNSYQPTQHDLVGLVCLFVRTIQEKGDQPKWIFALIQYVIRFDLDRVFCCCLSPNSVGLKNSETNKILNRNKKGLHHEKSRATRAYVNIARIVKYGYLLFTQNPVAIATTIRMANQKGSEHKLR